MSPLCLFEQEKSEAFSNPKPPVSHGDFRRFFYKATTKSILKARRDKRKGGNEVLLLIEA